MLALAIQCIATLVVLALLGFSIGNPLLLLAWSRSRGIALFERDRTMAPGLAAGGLFAAEFFLIYYGLAHTLASRMVI